MKTHASEAPDEAKLIRTLFHRDRLPMIMQAEGSDCGLACLAMIASFYGFATTLTALRLRFSTSMKGATLRSLMDIADTLGLSSRPVRLELWELKQLKTPAILHWDLKHFVVLSAVKGSRVALNDPALGIRYLALDDISSHFTGVALELTPTSYFQKNKRADTLGVFELFGYTKGLVGMVTQLFALAVALQLFALISPILNQTIVDDVLTRFDSDLLIRVIMGMAFLAIIKVGLSYLRGYLSLYMNTQLSFQMQTNLLRHALRLPISWFEKRHMGDVLSRFNSLQPVQSLLTDSLPIIILDLMMFTLGLMMMIIYAPLLTGIIVASVIAGVLARLLFYPSIRSLATEGLHFSAKVQSTFLETIRGVRTFKAFGRERERVSVWQNDQAIALNNSVELARLNLAGAAAGGVLEGVQQLAIWYVGARMVMAGNFTIGMLFAYQAYTSQFTGAAARLSAQFFNFRTLRIHLERLSEIVHSQPEAAGIVEHSHEADIYGKVSARGLCFRYADHEPYVLSDISFDIEAGEYVCFVGPSGHGKTTLVKLLLGFYQPTKGEIIVDGIALKNMGLQAFRSKVGSVLQDDQLFAGTVADNISFFDPEMDMEEIYEAARAAEIHEDILRLPMGYMSLVGDMGSILSGGQRQRVFLARALYRKPAVIIMDEGTAHLDTESERRIMKNLQKLRITRIAVAHRDAAIRSADRVLAIVNGQLSAPEEVQINV